MKKYIAPEIIVNEFMTKDVLTFSWSTSDPNMGTEDEWAGDNSGTVDVGDLWGELGGN